MSVGGHEGRRDDATEEGGRRGRWRTDRVGVGGS